MRGGVGGCTLVWEVCDCWYSGVLPFRGMADYRLAHQFHSLLETPTLFWWLECTCRMCDG